VGVSNSINLLGCGDANSSNSLGCGGVTSTNLLECGVNKPWSMMINSKYKVNVEFTKVSQTSLDAALCTYVYVCHW